MPFEQLEGAKYISLTTYRKDGRGVATPVWFSEAAGRLYVMTRGDSPKIKRLGRNPRVEVAPCTIRGRVTGGATAATARVLPESDWPRARNLIRKKYWLARLPFWSPKNVYLEIEEVA